MALPENRNKVDSHGPMVPTAVVVRLVSTKSTYPALAHVKRMKEITIHRTMFQHRVLWVIPLRNVMAGRICSHLFNATGTKTMTGFGAAHTTTLFPRTLLAFHGGIFAVAPFTIFAGL